LKINDKLKMPRFWFVALLVYLGIIFALSHISAADLLMIRLPIWDKSIHFFEYLPVGFMVTGLLCAKFPGSKTTVILPAVMALSLLLGGLDEFHQAFVPGRQVSLGDVIADVLGATVGAVLALHLLKSTVNRIDITTALQTGSKRQP
jgi:hypothetical protein